MEKFTTSDLKLINDQIEDMESSIKILEETFQMQLNDILRVTPECSEKIHSMTEQQIEELTEENIDEFIQFVEDVDLEKRAKDYEITVFEYKVKTLKDIKTNWDDIDNYRKEYADMLEEKDTLVKDYYEYIKSPEYAAKRAERIEKLKERMETETDGYKARQMKKTLAMYESLNTLSFIFTRIAGRDSEKEIRSIINAFFEPQRGNYVMNKFDAKCKKLGIKPSFYGVCLGLEDKFLPEEYAPFNNLFLFVLMRFIAYVDTSNMEDRTYATHLVMDILKLFSHQFNSQDEELEFIDTIKRFEDYFVTYIEEFKEKNVTYREHPTRIQREKEIEEMEAQRQKELEEQELATNAEVDSTIEPIVEVSDEELEKAIEEEERELEREAQEERDYEAAMAEDDDE